jgi:hypothetical protein
MTLKAIPNAQALLSQPGAQLSAILKELQGLSFSLVAGAAAGTAMNIAAMRLEDTVLSAISTSATTGAQVDQTGTITIQDTHASGTLTVASDPTDGDTVTVNGHVYTLKTTPTAIDHVKITVGNTTTTAAALAAAINAWETRVQTALAGDANHTALVVATSATNVVTVKAVVDGAAGNGIYSLATSGPRVTVSGGFVTGGTDTGSIKSSANLTGLNLLVVWFNKQ